MLYKNARPGYKRFIKKSATILLAIEVLGFAVTYAGWQRLNTNRDFRHYIKENYPSILENYYQLGEYLSGDKTIRNHDELVWKQEKASLAATATTSK
ncbi:protein CEBPZOS [Malaya genurostris]|uniref:protein CEBPZOS n=1 Tax=Malaya genurostris TaxID=325434 RepID=UPI0026F3CEE1|nr:protein CEBPZOS [Malaya genurostris]